jgi:hypothetical protein
VVRLARGVELFDLMTTDRPSSSCARRSFGRLSPRPRSPCAWRLGLPTLPCLWALAIRRPPRQICTRTCIRPQGERQISVPLCRLHHRELHRRGNERPWQRQGIEPLAIASLLWQKSHGLEPIIDDAAQRTRPQKMNGGGACHTAPDGRDK